MGKYIILAAIILCIIGICVLLSRARKKEKETEDRQKRNEKCKDEAVDRMNEEYRKSEIAAQNEMYTYASQHLIRCIMDLAQHSALAKNEVLHTEYSKHELVQELESMGVLGDNPGVEIIFRRYASTTNEEYSKDNYLDLFSFIQNIENWYKDAGLEFPLKKEQKGVEEEK